MDDGAFEIFTKMGQLEQAKDWDALIKLAEEQMKERPEWLTPYVEAGMIYLQRGQKEKALKVLDIADKRIAGNPDYEQLNGPPSEMLKILRDR